MLLGEGQQVEEGSKQSNLCHFTSKIFALQFSLAINILHLSEYLEDREKLFPDENGSGIDNPMTILSEITCQMSAAEFSLVATGIDLLYGWTIEINKRLWLKLRYTGLQQNHFDDTGCPVR